MRKPNWIFPNSFAKVFVVIALLTSSMSQLAGQHKLIPLVRAFTSEVERSVILSDSLHHTAMKPFVEDRFDLTEVQYFKRDTSKYYYKFSTLFWRDNLVKVKQEDFVLTVDPLFDFSFTKDFADTSSYADTVRIWNNSRGVRIEADIADVVSFQTTIFESQSYFPSYLKAISDSLGVVPGMARWKLFRTSGFDYGMSGGILSIAARNWLNIQFGHGKNFIGHGYRSVLLSDAAINYPYLKLTGYFFRGKLQYSATVAQLQSLNRLPLGEVPEALFSKKSASFNYLSWKPNASIEIGLFESTIWQHWDSSGVKPFNPAILVPVIGAGVSMNSFDGVNNSMLGINAKIRLYEGLSVYGQLAADQTGANGNAFQIGTKYLDFFIPQLDLQFEWNYVGSTMYRSTHTLQNYGHFNQSLGTVAGSGSQEFVGIMSFARKKFISQLKFNWIQRKDINKNGLNNVISKTESLVVAPHQYVQQWELQAGWRINPKTNMQLLFGFTDRLQRPDLLFRHTSALFVTFRTSLNNRYFDF